MASTISIISSAKIDRVHWDNCITRNSNGLIYAHSFYLDAMADNWEGLVIGNYKAVMPLPWRKKFGIRYVYTPAFIQQLGLTGEISKQEKEELVKRITAFVKYGDLFFNHENNFIQSEKNVSSLTNFVIDLSKGYEQIQSGYKKTLLNDLRNGAKEGLIFDEGNDIEQTILLSASLYQERIKHVTADDRDNFTSLCNRLQTTDQCLIRKVKNENGNLLAASLLLKDERRIYHLLNAVTDEGRKTEANHFLIDNMLREFSGSHLIFDFEGSDLPGVKKFYEKFGGVNQPYYHWHFNHLPFPLKWLKR